MRSVVFTVFQFCRFNFSVPHVPSLSTHTHTATQCHKHYYRLLCACGMHAVLTANWLTSRYGRLFCASICAIERSIANKFNRYFSYYFVFVFFLLLRNRIRSSQSLSVPLSLCWAGKPIWIYAIYAAWIVCTCCCCCCFFKVARCCARARQSNCENNKNYVIALS